MERLNAVSRSVTQHIDLAEVAREKIVNSALFSLLVFGVLAFGASVLRSLSIGWQPIMTFHFVIWCLIVGVTILRHHLPLLFRAYFLIGVMLALCLFGLWSFGLIRMSVPGLLMTTVLTALLFGSRVGGMMAGVSVILIAAAGSAVNQGWVTFNFDLDVYATAPTPWLVAIFASFMLIGFCLFGLSWTHEALADSRRNLEESEQRFRDYATAASDWFWQTDAAHRFTYISDRAYEIHRLTPDYGIGMTREELGQVYESTEIENGYRETIAEHKPFRNVVSWRITGDGRKLWIRASGAPVFDVDGDFRGYRGASTDITAEQQLRQAQAQRAELIVQVAGGVAHEFNNLMAVIIGNAMMLEEAVGDNETGNEDLQAIVRSVKRGSSLTDKLLAFSQQQPLSPVVTEVGELIGGLEDMLRHALGETLVLRVIAAPDLWPALIDPHQFESALRNLAMNARDAMPQGGILVIETANVTFDEAYAQQQEEVTPGDYVEVAARDNGTGMPAEVLEKAFEPFFTTKDVGEGSGLGLSMVYGFTKQSDGHVTIDSEVGHGTTIKLYLPRFQEIVASDDTANNDA